MADKPQKRKSAVGRTERRSRKPLEEKPSRKDAAFPDNAVPADQTQQVPNNSYSPAPRYYVDQAFICDDCKRREVWTATQQKWYYEVAKGSLYARAVRCRACRRKHRETHSGRGDPNPIKHAGSLWKQIRQRIEPCLSAAGFTVDRRSDKSERWATWIEYAGPNNILRCTFDSRRGHIVAESMNDAEYRTVVDVELGSVNSTDVLLERLDQFSDQVCKLLKAPSP